LQPVLFGNRELEYACRLAITGDVVTFVDNRQPTLRALFCTFNIFVLRDRNRPDQRADNCERAVSIGDGA
jgi:hypothetical protein